MRYYFPVNQWVVARQDYHRLLKQVPGLTHPMLHSLRRCNAGSLSSRYELGSVHHGPVSSCGSFEVLERLSLRGAQVYINGTSSFGTFENYVSPALMTSLPMSPLWLLLPMRLLMTSYVADCWLLCSSTM